MGSATDGYELAIERRISAPPARVWEVWTKRLEEWWAPRPWMTKIIAQDFRAGGRSCIAMKGPDDAEWNPMEGVFLEIVPERKIVITDAFRAGWIPQTAFMTAFFTFEPDGDGTLYRAGSRHWNEETMKQHEQMGFAEGWAQCARQLADIVEKGAIQG